MSRVAMSKPVEPERLLHLQSKLHSPVPVKFVQEEQQPLTLLLVLVVQDFHPMPLL